jgi:hypothetical protein
MPHDRNAITHASPLIVAVSKTLHHEISPAIANGDASAACVQNATTKTAENTPNVPARARAALKSLASMLGSPCV